MASASGLRPRRGQAEGPRRSLAMALALVLSSILLLSLAALGCARSAARPPAPSRAERPAAAPEAPASRQALPRAPAPAPAPARVAPGEVMTPEELATIPDPVPEAPTAADSAPALGTEGRAHDVPPPADHSAKSPGEALEGPSGARTAGSSVWRVQIFASPDLQLADRQAKQASARFGVPASIEFEASLYKVRLGEFASEEEAQALRERAVREGYPGAFRVRQLEPTTKDAE